MLSGGEGNDLFIVQTATEHDVISDFDLSDANHDGRTNDQFDVSDLQDSNGNPIKAFDVSIIDDGHGNATLQFPGGEQITVVGLSPAEAATPGKLYSMGIPCFVRGTRITTIRGEVPVEDLTAGDFVLTVDNGYKPILWIGSRKVDGRGHLAPIRFDVGVLMNERPLTVSPQHRVQVKSAIAARMFGSQAVLVAAKHLLGLPGVSQTPVGQVEYFHFLLDQHELVVSEGAVTETLFTGPEALRVLEPDARSEILSIFPDLADLDYARLCSPIRPLVTGRLGRQLAARHLRNNKRLVF